MEINEMLEIQFLFKDLNLRIDDLAKNKIIQPEPMESPTIKSLAAALSKAQSEFTFAFKNQKGVHDSEYSDLTSCFKAIKLGLGKYELSFTQPIIETDSGMYLYTIIRHSSGEWMKSKMRVIQNYGNDMQKLCSQITYLKRYSISAMLGIAGTDDDDDAEEAVKDARNEAYAGVSIMKQSKMPEKTEVKDTLSKRELDALNEELKGMPDMAQEILTKMGLRSLADIPGASFAAIISVVREVKNARAGKK